METTYALTDLTVPEWTDFIDGPVDVRYTERGGETWLDTAKGRVVLNTEGEPTVMSIEVYGFVGNGNTAWSATFRGTVPADVVLATIKGALA